MMNERGESVIQAGPSTPVLVLGLDGAPTAGDEFNVLDKELRRKNCFKENAITKRAKYKDTKAY